MQLSSVHLLFAMLTQQALTAPTAMMATLSEPDRIEVGSAQIIPTPTLENTVIQPSTTELPLTPMDKHATTLKETTPSHINSFINTKLTNTASPAQPTFVPGSNNSPTIVQVANVAITAMGLPIAGVMLYLAWVTFLRERNVQAARNSAVDPEEGTWSTGEDVGGANENIELVEYAIDAPYAYIHPTNSALGLIHKACLSKSRPS